MAICSNCGKNVTPGSMFCENCGTRVAPQPAPAAAPGGYGAAPGGYGAAPGGYRPGSDWDGGVLETIAASILCSLITSITCGIGAPWGICYLYKFIIEHTTIDGKRLRFDGTGGDLLGQWIVWLILTTVTCGIYGLWVVPKLYKWIASHTHFA